MRNFCYKFVKNIIFVYVCFMCLLSYRLIYNELYFDIHEEIQVSNGGDRLVYPSGKIVGIYTECKGVFVIDTCEIESKDGMFYNPAGSVVKTGDYIIAINEQELDSKEEMINIIKSCEGQELELSISRDDEVFNTTVTPIESKNGNYMLGIWVKDDLAGVGTITYFTEQGDFAALGHGMGDGETDNLLAVKGGDVYFSNIIGIEKGQKGNPGEVKGVIYYGLMNHLGKVGDNNGNGIFGKLDKEDLNSYLNEGKICEIGLKQDVQIGDAQIVSEVSGKLETYDIKITYVDYLVANSKKGLHIEVIDSDLLELTGGIVQGMSGSPIIQNGKLIGAVTHVLINDPSKGYGIFIEEMLKE